MKTKTFSTEANKGNNVRSLFFVLFVTFCSILSLVAQTTNNPGVPIFGAGGTSSGLQFVFVNGLGFVASPVNFVSQNANSFVTSSGATNSLGARVAFVSDFTTNWVTPEQFGALGGTNNDTAAFSNMLAFVSANSPGAGVIIRNRSYTISNLVMPNNVTIIGQNAVIYPVAGATNFLIDGLWATNCFISGLTLNGTNYSALSGRTLTTCHGIRLSQIGGNLLQNCTVFGFGGYSIFVQGTNADNTGGWDQRISAVNDCITYSNYFGPTFQSATSVDGLRGEYVSCKGLQSFENVVGVWPEAGNLMFTACRITGNQIGIYVQGGQPNNTHGTFVGCAINHNTQSMSLTGVSNGELFSGCWFAADGGGGISITNSKGVSLDNCYLDTGITVTTSGGTSGYNMIENCEFTGQWGIDVQLQNLDGTLGWYNNHSRDNLTGDWSHKYGIPILNGVFDNATAASGSALSPSPTSTYNFVSWNNTSPVYQIYKLPHGGNSTNSLFTFLIQSITNQTMTLQVNDISHPPGGGGNTQMNAAGTLTLTLTNGVNRVLVTNNWPDNISAREVAFIWGTSTNTTTYLIDAEYGY